MALALGLAMALALACTLLAWIGLARLMRAVTEDAFGSAWDFQIHAGAVLFGSPARLTSAGWVCEHQAADE